MQLSSLEIGKYATITSLSCDNYIKRRLMDLGMTKGTSIRCVQKSSSVGSIAFAVRGTVIALRYEDAINISVKEC